MLRRRFASGVFLVGLSALVAQVASASSVPNELAVRPDWQIFTDLTPTIKELDPATEHVSTTLASAVPLNRSQIRRLAQQLLDYRRDFFAFVRRTECFDPGELHVFIVPTHVLNDPKNFPKLTSDGQTLYGAYRPLSRSLYVTPQVLRQGEGSGLAHELAHHYYYVCGLQQREPLEHLRVRSFERLIDRHGNARWPSTHTVTNQLSLPGTGSVEWSITVESEVKVESKRAARLTYAIRRAVSGYLQNAPEQFWCKSPEPLRVRLVPRRAFPVTGKKPQTDAAHFFSDLGELYLPISSKVSRRALAREGAWIAHSICQSTFQPTADTIEGFAASFANKPSHM